MSSYVMLVDEYEADLSAIQFKLSGLMATFKDIQHNGVSQDTVLGIENLCPDIISDNVPLFSYTSTLSSVNAGYALESLKNKILRTLVNLLIKSIEFFYKAVNFVVTRTARLAFSLLLSKVDGKETSTWEEIRYSFSSDETRAMVDTYSDLVDTGMTGYIEDNLKRVPSDEQFYEILNESLRLVEESLSEVETLVGELSDSPTEGKLKALMVKLDKTIKRLHHDESRVVLYQDLDENRQTPIADMDTRSSLKRVKADPVEGYLQQDPIQLLAASNRKDKAVSLMDLKRRGRPSFGVIERIAKTQGFKEESERQRVRFEAHMKDVGDRLAGLLTELLKLEKVDAQSDIDSLEQHVQTATQSVNYINKHIRSFNHYLTIQETVNKTKVNMVVAASRTLKKHKKA